MTQEYPPADPPSGPPRKIWSVVSFGHPKPRSAVASYSHPRCSKVFESSHETGESFLLQAIHNPDPYTCSACHRILASILWESSFEAFDARPRAG